MDDWQHGWFALALGCTASLHGCERKVLPQPVPDASVSPEVLSSAERRERMRMKLRGCHQMALKRQPGLAVDTNAHYVARNGKLTFVEVDIPAAPDLAVCVCSVITEAYPIDPVGNSSGAGVGIVRIRLDTEGVLAPPTKDESMAQLHEFVRRAVERGALRPDEMGDAYGTVRNSRKPVNP